MHAIEDYFFSTVLSLPEAVVTNVVIERQFPISQVPPQHSGLKYLKYVTQIAQWRNFALVDMMLVLVNPLLSCSNALCFPRFHQLILFFNCACLSPFQIPWTFCMTVQKFYQNVWQTNMSLIEFHYSPASTDICPSSHLQRAQIMRTYWRRINVRVLALTNTLPHCGMQYNLYYTTQRPGPLASSCFLWTCERRSNQGTPIGI